MIKSANIRFMSAVDIPCFFIPDMRETSDDSLRASPKSTKRFAIVRMSDAERSYRDQMCIPNLWAIFGGNVIRGALNLNSSCRVDENSVSNGWIEGSEAAVSPSAAPVTPRSQWILFYLVKYH